MTAVLKVVRPEAASAGAARAPAPPARADAPTVARRVAARLRSDWLPRAAWTVSRTGRAGLVGIALLLAAGLFLASTHRQVVAEVAALRAELASAPSPSGTASTEAADPAVAATPLPSRADMPAILRQLFHEAVQARLAIDTAKYEVNATKGKGVIRYHIAFPVTGPYPQVRAFVDATLAKMPAVGLSELALARKSIADANVEAQLRMTVYTVAEARPRAAAGSTGARPASDRVVASAHAAALFAQHTWVVLQPAPPPAPPPPPPAPTAPPLPYAFLGSFAPEGERPVFFLARGDRVIDAHIGDVLDGVYKLESAAGGQLVFVYTPLGVRQNLPAGASK